MRLLVTFFLLYFGLLGCDRQQSGPEDVVWDRDTCTRCQMMLSERHAAAQIRIIQTDSRSKLYKFDDFGCAVLWLEKQDISTVQSVEFWIADAASGKWIDAHNAWFMVGQQTPMDYGVLAYEEKIANSVNFEAAKEHVRKAESRHGMHDKHSM